MNKIFFFSLSFSLLALQGITALPTTEKNSQKNSSTPFVPAQAREFASRAERAFASGDIGQAESLYKEALTFCPNNDSLLVSLAAVETRMGQPDQSEKFLEQALHLNFRNAPAWLLLGMNYLEQKRDEEAFAALVQATLYDDRNPRGHNYLGIASGRKGWKEASEEELRRAIELDPKYADANFNLAVLYLRHTPPLTELARRHYQQALDLGSSKDPVVEAQLAKAVASTPASPTPSSVLP